MSICNQRLVLYRSTKTLFSLWVWVFFMNQFSDRVKHYVAFLYSFCFSFRSSRLLFEKSFRLNIRGRFILLPFLNRLLGLSFVKILLWRNPGANGYVFFPRVLNLVKSKQFASLLRYNNQHPEKNASRSHVSSSLLLHSLSMLHASSTWKDRIRTVEYRRRFLETRFHKQGFRRHSAFLKRPFDLTSFVIIKSIKS